MQIIWNSTCNFREIGITFAVYFKSRRNERVHQLQVRHYNGICQNRIFPWTFWHREKILKLVETSKCVANNYIANCGKCLFILVLNSIISMTRFNWNFYLILTLTNFDFLTVYWSVRKFGILTASIIHSDITYICWESGNSLHSYNHHIMTYTIVCKYLDVVKLSQNSRR